MLFCLLPSSSLGFSQATKLDDISFSVNQYVKSGAAFRPVRIQKAEQIGKNCSAHTKTENVHYKLTD